MNRIPSSQELKELAQKHSLELVVLFGSQATGKTHAESDIDVAVLPQAGVKIDQLRLIFDLALLFHSDKIDLVNLQTASSVLQFSVCQQGKLLYGNKRLFIQQQLRAFHLYNDMLPKLSDQRMRTRERLQQYVTT